MLGITAFFMGGICALGQDLQIYGVVKDTSSVRLAGAQVQVFKEKVKVVSVIADSLGKYSVLLDYHIVFEMEYTYPGMVTKRIVIDGTALPKATKDDDGYGMNVDIKLFRPHPHVDYKFMNEPMGIARFDVTMSNMAWDIPYTQAMLDRISAAHGTPIRKVLLDAED